jgi:hypothetical protein
MNLESTIPIIVAIVSALGGFIVWIAQKIRERRDTERLRKEELYKTLLAATVEFASYANAAPLVIESQRAWLYASDEVLRAISGYLKSCAGYVEQQGKSDININERWAAVKEAEDVLRLAVRRDLSPGTRINEEWLRQEWEIITSHQENIMEYLGRNPRGETKPPIPHNIL